MSVTNTASTASFTLDQTTSTFTFTFRALTSTPTDIKAIITTNSTNQNLVYTTDYTVAVDSDGVGGVLTLVSPSTHSKGTLTVYRSTTNLQESDYDDYNQFPADTLETDLDRRTLVSQEQAEQFTRTLLLPITVTGVSTTLPNPVAGKVIGWSTGALSLTNYDSSADSITIAASSATAALASQTAAGVSSTSAGLYATTSSTQALAAASHATTALNAAASIPSTPFSQVNGGTGISVTGSTLQVLRMNAAASGLEYATISTAGFTNRGDPSGADFTQATMITDATWRDMDLSSIVSSGTTAILLAVRISDDLADQQLQFRENGNSNDYNVASFFTQAANVNFTGLAVVTPDANRIIEYYGTNTTFSAISVTVAGWWQ